MSIEESLPQFLLPTVILSSRVGFAAAAQPGPARQDCRAIRVPKGPQLLAGLGAAWYGGGDAVTLWGWGGPRDGKT